MVVVLDCLYLVFCILSVFDVLLPLHFVTDSFKLSISAD